MDSSGLHSQRLDHLGIVAGICNQIGLIEQIDQRIGPNKRKVSVGPAVLMLRAFHFVDTLQFSASRNTPFSQLPCKK